MRSGNGRHRRPRQVPAIVVTAGVTGSALALPLLAATNASAADAATWDKVAECESGGSWSANAGTGAYGGLQFSQEEWKNAGGLSYAERADLASRSQQIAVAERVLASQGPEAWSTCASPAGLTKDGPSADVNPGNADAPGPVAPSPSRPDAKVPVQGNTPARDYGAPTPKPGLSGSPTGLPDLPQGPSLGLPVMPEPDLPSTTPTTPTSPTTPGGPSTDPTSPTTPVDPSSPTAPTSPSGTPGNPAAPGTPGATTGPSASPSPSGAAGAAGESAGKHRGAPAVETASAPDAASDPTYTVKAGDSLAAIADAKGVKGGWNALYQANEQVIGGNADLIKPGQNLDLAKK
ncbi:MULTISPECIES: transglycosylase family protein [unclassified Streptomyces]|uniref:transglycosylase family protein n=1 Tax=unclassified Streptomyces TaxID=2593676 RepID=UPI0022524035|nr:MULTISPECIES: transglycosylase family protein [unclassified Streptomyces]MCX4526207.1 transglycosylase family protein [Streptomyces sp. NBC_01551]MCX4543228.1 transglycosylase family protein [Streptomyces sp. NBC_01565]